MDYVYEGLWSDDLGAKLKEWIDKKWIDWGEDSPGTELVDFIKVSELKFE